MTHRLLTWRDRVLQHLADAAVELEFVREDHCVFWIRMFASGMFGRGDFRTAMFDARGHWHRRNDVPAQGSLRSGVTVERTYQAALQSIRAAAQDVEFRRRADVDMFVDQQRDGLMELRGLVERVQFESVDRVVAPERAERRESERSS